MRFALALMAAALVLLAGFGCAGQQTRRHAELTRYLERVAAEEDRYQSARARAVAALESASAEAADASWERAAAQLQRSEREYDRLALRLRAIRPPAELRTEHAGMIKSLHLYRDLLDGIRQPMGRHDLAGVGRSVARTTRLGISANQLRTSWRTAAKAAADRAGVAFPAALNRIGLLDGAKQR